jgi:hypothetical protein
MNKEVQQNKETRGRKSVYKESYPELLIEFFDREHFTEINGKKFPNPLPSIERFCCNIKISTTLFYSWCKEYPELKDAFHIAKQFQKDQLVSLSLMGFYKEGFAKFLAINATDMKSEAMLVAEQQSTISTDKPPLQLNYSLKAAPQIENKAGQDE